MVRKKNPCSVFSSGKVLCLGSWKRKWNISLFTNLPRCTYLRENYSFVQGRHSSGPSSWGSDLLIRCAQTEISPKKDHSERRRVSGYQNEAGNLSEFIAYEFTDCTFFSNIFQMIGCFHTSTPTHACKELSCPKIVCVFRERNNGLVPFQPGEDAWACSGAGTWLVMNGFWAWPKAV